MPMDVWAIIFAVATFLGLAHTWFFSRTHFSGMAILAGNLGLNWIARLFYGDYSPVIAYVWIDVMCVILYWIVSSKQRAIWASICVILFVSMTVTHVGYVLSDEVNEYAYLRQLDILFALTWLCINLTALIWRWKPGHELDSFIARIVRGWNWSGVCRSSGAVNHS